MRFPYFYFMSRKSTKYSHKTSRNRRSGKGKPPSLKLLRWFALAVVVVIFVVFFTGNRSIFKLIALHNQKTRLEQQKVRLQEEQKELEEEIDKLKNDPKYIEKIAREKYKMRKKGEEVYEIEPK